MHRSSNFTANSEKEFFPIKDREKKLKEVPHRTISPLCIDAESYALGLTAPASVTYPIPGCSRTPSRTFYRSTVTLAASPSYTGQLQRFVTSVRSSCSADIHPNPNSSDLMKCGTTSGSSSVEEALLLRGTKRKHSEEDDSGPQRKRQETIHQEMSLPERGIKRKHWSDHTENNCKRLKRWHWTDSPNFTVTCPKTCACKVGQSRIIPIKRHLDVGTPLLKDVLKDNLYVSASTYDIDCCEKQCYWY